MDGVLAWMEVNFESVTWSASELSSILWSIFVKDVGAKHKNLVKMAWERCIKEGKNGLNQQSLMSLVQVQVVADVVEGIRLDFGEGWGEEEGIEGGINVSKLQREIFAILKDKRGSWDWKEEVRRIDEINKLLVKSLLRLL